MPTPYHIPLVCQILFYINHGIDNQMKVCDTYKNMARISLNNNYGFPIDRGPFTPRPAELTEEQYLIHALKEGYALLAAETKEKTPNSVKSNSVTPSQKLEDALAQKSDNPYVRARNTVLTRMLPSDRSVIEQMESGALTKDARYDTFVKAVAALGDKISDTQPSKK